jgi:phospholipid/cholesterol/gamma-HCH transport system permease protein
MVSGTHAGPTTTVARHGREATVHVHGDLVIATAGRLYGGLRGAGRRRDVSHLVIDFSGAGRLDSSAIAVVSLVSRQLTGRGKRVELRALSAAHQAAFDMLPAELAAPTPAPAMAGLAERVGDEVIGVCAGARSLWQLGAEVGRQLGAIATGRKRLPVGALHQQIIAMGLDGIAIVGLINFLVGTTMAFQGVVQLQRFGAGVFVADMVGMSVVRELAPLMTAVIITGRTGAAIAAELGTMQVRSEVDALGTMGINPVRFLVLPRLLAITFIVPALTLIAMFVGMIGGQLVAAAVLDLSAVTFWSRLADRLTLADFGHGLGKSVVFAWVIGFAGCHFGLRAGTDASGVGTATTRTVVSSIFAIIIVDALFATVSSLLGHG